MPNLAWRGRIPDTTEVPVFPPWILAAVWLPRLKVSPRLLFHKQYELPHPRPPSGIGETIWLEPDPRQNIQNCEYWRLVRRGLQWAYWFALGLPVRLGAKASRKLELLAQPWSLIVSWGYASKFPYIFRTKCKSRPGILLTHWNHWCTSGDEVDNVYVIEINI